MSQDRATLESAYDHLLTLWTSGVRDYHAMLSDYLTANSIFVAVIGLLVSRESLALPFTVLILLLCIFGLLLSLQMAIVLGRFSGQNALWEWQMRGIEQAPEWKEHKLLTGLHQLHESRQPVENLRNEPTVFTPNWAFPATVAAGKADAGFGLEAAARQFGLGFVPIAAERYLFPCRRSVLRDVAVQRFRELLANAATKRIVDRLAGYALDAPGELASPADLRSI